MCNKINGNPAMIDIKNMVSMLMNSSSELQSWSGLSNDNINHMYHIYQVLINSVNKYRENKAISF